MDECLAICDKVKRLTEESFSGNSEYILGKVFYVMSGVYRQRNEFELARIHMDNSTEVYFFASLSIVNVQN